MIGASGCALLAGIAIVNDTMRNRFGGVFHGTAIGEATSVLRAVQRVAQNVFETIGYSSTEHTAMTLFAASAAVLFVLTLRT